MRVAGLFLVVAGTLALLFYGASITGVSHLGDENTLPVLISGVLLTIGLLTLTLSARQPGQH